MISYSDYIGLDARGLADGIRRGAFTEIEVLEACLTRIDSVGPIVNAISIRCFDHAEVHALEGSPIGPLSGVPFLFKDLGAPSIHVPASNGSRFFQHQESNFDSATVKSLGEAGLNFIGRSNSPEFGIMPTTEPLAYGSTHNPWRLTHSAGGSSGGAAAAVASGIVPAAHATDTLGSIRLPASACGVFGLKPSRGIVPVGPHRRDANQGLSHEHCITRTVGDCALLLDILAKPDEGGWFQAPPRLGAFSDTYDQAPQSLLIGLMTTAADGISTVHQNCRDAVEIAGRLCETLGHKVEPIAFDFSPNQLIEDCLLLVVPGVAAAVGQREDILRRRAGNDIEPLTHALISRFGRTTVVELQSSLGRLNAVARRLIGQMQAYDLILTPTMPVPPSPLGQMSPRDMSADRYVETMQRLTSFTAFANVTGQPAMNLPLGPLIDGLPIGVQAVGRLGSDLTLLQLAAQLEPHFLKLPSIEGSTTIR